MLISCHLSVHPLHHIYHENPAEFLDLQPTVSDTDIWLSSNNLHMKISILLNNQINVEYVVTCTGGK